ncbi:endoplasmic reticulum-golgi intermediate compartment protein 3 [Blastocladiella britannica]|nr:endoplasmic reticulum-golgi intermediate compartment protein 3 [Blastocladiella britannica]
MSAGSPLSRLDVFAKTLDDFRVRTRSGGLLTLAAAALVAILLVSEYIDYATPTFASKLVVETGRKAKMDIAFNLTVPKVPCAILSLDVMDVSGEHHSLEELKSEVFKVRLDPSGKRVPVDPERSRVVGLAKNTTDPSKPYCGGCYGATALAANGCCNTCKDIEDAYSRMGWSFRGAETMEQCIAEGYAEKLKQQDREGCLLYGHLSVNKVAGNFHLAPGRSFEQAGGDLMSLLGRQFDFTHHIHQLTFGPVAKGISNPLDDVQLMQLNGDSHLVQYFIKVVGTEFRYLNGSTVSTNQFSVTEHARDVAGPGGIGLTALPGIFFNYEISPMRVVQTEAKKSVTYFLTSVCAVVGGVVTVAGMVDAAVYRTERAWKKKVALGKVN